MPSRDDYMNVAKQIAQHMNAFRLAFKSYNVSELDEMIAAVAGPGSRVSGDATSDSLKTCLLERGFTVFPDIASAEDGYILRSAGRRTNISGVLAWGRNRSTAIVSG